MLEGSGSRAGSIPLTSGSGSGRPKNTWTRSRTQPTSTGKYKNTVPLKVQEYLPTVSLVVSLMTAVGPMWRRSCEQRCGTVIFFTVPVPTFEKLWFRFQLLKSYGSGSYCWKVTVPVKVPAPYLDHKKPMFPKKKLEIFLPFYLLSC